MAKRRLICISDTHCGHRVGLTPPNWQNKTPTTKYDHIQKALYDEYLQMVKKYRKKDMILVVNGDCIDGKGTKSGSTELNTVAGADRNKQVEMAIEAIKEWKTENIIITAGTPYHTGVGEDFEENVAKGVNAKKFGGQEWVEVNGRVFDFKHFVSNSSIPHGKGTPIAKDRLWNLIWAEFKEQPKADFVIRSHVHSFDYIGGHNWLALTTPALQGQGSKFGSRIPSKRIDFGLVWFDIQDDGRFTWGWDTRIVEIQKAKPIRF